MKPDILAALGSAGILALVMATGPASGQDYPNKPIHVITGGIGGMADFTARLMAPDLLASLGQPLIVDNRDTTVALQGMARGAADGYTVLFTGSNFWVVPQLQKVPYDPVKDFAPVTLSATQPNILVVLPSLPVKSVQELIALAKAKPGTLNYAIGSTGGSSHLASEIFRTMAGVNIVGIPYRGQAQAINDLLGERVQIMFATAAAGMPQVKAGRLKGLAVTSTQPSTVAPGLPTMAASGLPGFEAVSNNAVFVAANTPAVIINRLNREIVRVLSRADVKEKYLGIAAETVASSPQELAATIKSEIGRVAKLVRDGSIKGE